MLTLGLGGAGRRSSGDGVTSAMTPRPWLCSIGPLTFTASGAGALGPCVGPEQSPSPHHPPVSRTSGSQPASFSASSSGARAGSGTDTSIASTLRGNE